MNPRAERAGVLFASLVGRTLLPDTFVVLGTTTVKGRWHGDRSNAAGEQPFAIPKLTWVPDHRRGAPVAQKAVSPCFVLEWHPQFGTTRGQNWWLHGSFTLRFPLERPPISIILFRPSASPERIPCLGSGTYGRRRLPRNRRVRLFSPPATTPRDKSRGTPDTRAPRGRYAAKKPFALVLRSAAALWVQGRRTRPKRVRYRRGWSPARATRR